MINLLVNKSLIHNQNTKHIIHMHDILDRIQIEYLVHQTYLSYINHPFYSSSLIIMRVTINIIDTSTATRSKSILSLS